jgi:GTP:adenosylcobinamide-phosphate guanylyltransferase
MTNLQAVILTASRSTPSPLLQGTPYYSKTLLPVAGSPMLCWVLQALEASTHHPKIAISTEDPAVISLAAQRHTSNIFSPGKTAVQSFLNAIEASPTAEWVLIISGDHPLLSTKMVDSFITRAQQTGAALNVAVVSQHTLRAAHPASHRTFFPLKDGAYSGGNMYLLHRPSFQAHAPLLETLDKNRKNPWKTLLHLDLGFILAVLFRQLTLYDVARRISAPLGCPVALVEMPYAECGMDVDKPSDLQLADQILRQRGQSGKILQNTPAV